jgi:hypothetical protein
MATNMKKLADAIGAYEEGLTTDVECLKTIIVAALSLLEKVEKDPKEGKE